MSDRDFEEDSPSSRKGQQGADDLFDDLVNQITSKLGIKESKDDQVAVFMEVLQCNMQEAEFFLDSSNWDIARAVELCIEAGGEYTFGKRRRGGRDNDNVASQSIAAPLFSRPAYSGREVRIEGLDPAWTARVSKSTGRIVFRHLESGFEQFEVPPGFDDTPDQAADGGAAVASSDMDRSFGMSGNEMQADINTSPFGVSLADSIGYIPLFPGDGASAFTSVLPQTIFQRQDALQEDQDMASENIEDF